jgi:hypothetical protein
MKKKPLAVFSTYEDALHFVCVTPSIGTLEIKTIPGEGYAVTTSCAGNVFVDAYPVQSYVYTTPDYSFTHKLRSGQVPFRFPVEKDR